MITESCFMFGFWTGVVVCMVILIVFYLKELSQTRTKTKEELKNGRI